MEQKSIYINNTFTVENAVNDSDYLNIAGYCCKYNALNLNGEMVDSNSFNTFFKLRESGQIRPYFNWEHSDVTIGGIDEITSDDNGLFIKCHLTKAVAIVRDMIAPLVMSGDLDSFSTEGQVLNGYDGIIQLANGGYYVKDFILRGVSIVRLPACPDATFTLENFIKEYEERKREEEKKMKWYLY